MKEYIAPIGLTVGIIVIVLTGIVGLSCTSSHKDMDVDDEFEIKQLFTKDSCTVYRFEDRGRNHYFTDCSETMSDVEESCGKATCEYMENIPTDIFEDGGETI